MLTSREQPSQCAQKKSACCTFLGFSVRALVITDAFAWTWDGLSCHDKEPTSVPKNLTAAAMANGEIAANAAAAAGATPQAIIENAANTAGIEAAYSAQVQSLSPPEVEAAAAQAAEGSAKMVGATPEEAATAGGKVAVQVAQKAWIRDCQLHSLCTRHDCCPA